MLPLDKLPCVIFTAELALLALLLALLAGLKVVRWLATRSMRKHQERLKATHELMKRLTEIEEQLKAKIAVKKRERAHQRAKRGIYLAAAFFVGVGFACVLWGLKTALAKRQGGARV